MQRRETLYTFHLNDHFVLHNQIWSVLRDEFTPVVEWDPYLTRELHALRFRLNAERGFVDVLKKARTKPAMHFQGSSDDPFCKFSFSIHCTFSASQRLRGPCE